MFTASSNRYRGNTLIHMPIGKISPSTSSPTQRRPFQHIKNAQPNPRLQVSDTESAFQNSRSSSPYFALCPSRPESRGFDAESLFSNSDSMAAWTPPVSTSAPIPPNDEVLDPQIFAFSPSQAWRDTSYTSELITTNPEDVSSRNGRFVEGGQPCGENEHTAFDP